VLIKTNNDLKLVNIPKTGGVRTTGSETRSSSSLGGPMSNLKT